MTREEKAEKAGLTRQCTAFRKSDGERCTNIPVRGGNTCVVHGGGSPIARHAAQARLLAMCEPAFETLLEIMTDKLEDPKIRVQCAIAIMDRAGHGPHATLHTEPEKQDLSRLTLAELNQRAQETAARIAAAAEREAQEQANTVDGEVVPTPADDGSVH